MRKGSLEKEFITIFLSILILSGSALASGEDKTFRTQGSVMEMDSNRNILVVNEKIFTWNGRTVFRDQNGNPLKGLDKLKVNTWVYIVAEYTGLDRPHMAKEIYLLPKYIEEKEKDRYPFIIPFYHKK